MKDTLYETVLSAQQIDTIHGALIAQEKLYAGLVNSCDNPSQEFMNWMLANNVGKEVLQKILTQVQDMLLQVDNFVLGEKLPEGFKPKEALIFKEAFEPFSEF